MRSRTGAGLWQNVLARPIVSCVEQGLTRDRESDGVSDDWPILGSGGVFGRRSPVAGGGGGRVAFPDVAVVSPSVCRLIWKMVIHCNKMIAQCVDIQRKYRDGTGNIPRQYVGNISNSLNCVRLK